MTDDKYITLAIHTSERAMSLKRILESHGIDVIFENVEVSGSGIISGVRVKINEHDLPLALKVTESSECYVSREVLKFEDTEGDILIPVDFSQNSILACRIGFDLAQLLNLHPVIIHAYAAPYFGSNLMGSDLAGGGMTPDLGTEVAEMTADVDMQKESDSMMRDFRKKILDAQNAGTIANIKFATEVREGIPEDVIKEYCLQTPPVLVVMATRGKNKRNEALIGSVTAEVIDSCRVPVFVVPENCGIVSVEAVKKLVYFCNLDRRDILSVDSLMRMFDYPEADITLIPVNDKGGPDVKEKVNMLCDYFNKSYPASHFSTEVFPEKSFREDFENYITQSGVELLIVPNKKMNIFQRLVNPGIAHKLLFERDMPMLALPV